MLKCMLTCMAQKHTQLPDHKTPFPSTSLSGKEVQKETGAEMQSKKVVETNIINNETFH